MAFFNFVPLIIAAELEDNPDAIWEIIDPYDIPESE